MQKETFKKRNSPTSTYCFKGNTRAKIKTPVSGFNLFLICLSIVIGLSHRSKRLRQLIASKYFGPLSGKCHLSMSRILRREKANNFQKWKILKWKRFFQMKRFFLTFFKKYRKIMIIANIIAHSTKVT